MNTRAARAESRTELVVDWQECDGHGLCAELLPEVIRLDEFHYPIVERPVPKGAERHARNAVSACPKLALRLRTR